MGEKKEVGRSRKQRERKQVSEESRLDLCQFLSADTPI